MGSALEMRIDTSRDSHRKYPRDTSRLWYGSPVWVTRPVTARIAKLLSAHSLISKADTDKTTEMTEPKRLCQAAITACTGSLAGGRIPVAFIPTNPQSILPASHSTIYLVKSSKGLHNRKFTANQKLYSVLNHIYYTL